jgi:hypothetical protein
MDHPSKDLKARQNGFGVAAGIEKLYMKDRLYDEYCVGELYGSIPHSGYYGVGLGVRPFSREQAGYLEEISWYASQYGEKSG